MNDRPPLDDSRAGFAMPMTILVLVVVAISLAGSLSIVTSERRVIDNVQLQQEAFMLAQSGLDEFLTNRSGLGFTATPPAASESIELDIRNGTARVALERLRPATATTPAMYVVSSTGVIPGPRTQDPEARRTVAQLAFWQDAGMDAKAGWTTLTGLQKNGTAGTISGVDECGMQSDLPGVASPTNPGVTVSGNWEPDGDPPSEDMGTVQEAIDALGIDWEGIVNKTAILPTIEIPGDPWPSFADPDFWPIIHVTGDLSLPSTGRGILIVTGDLTMGGSVRWEGIVLVGRHVTSNGNNRVYGTTYSGLNAMLQPDPEAWAAALGQNAVGNGNKLFVYDSCAVERALQAFGGLRIIENAWMDNWPVL
ncbi:MAG: hypothetical protein WD013_03225 [Gemmatimonadota bacterium]